MPSDEVSWLQVIHDLKQRPVSDRDSSYRKSDYVFRRVSLKDEQPKYSLWSPPAPKPAEETMKEDVPEPDCSTP